MEILLTGLYCVENELFVGKQRMSTILSMLKKGKGCQLGKVHYPLVYFEFLRLMLEFVGFWKWFNFSIIELLYYLRIKIEAGYEF